MTGEASILAARRSPHSFGHRAARMAWSLVQGTLFRLSPRPLHRWRAWLLRRFGARIDPTARVYPRARIWAPWNLSMDRYATIADDVEVYSVAPITLGEAATVSQFSHLCAATHDFEDPAFPLLPKPITIGARAWIAAEVFVGPGVAVGEGAVVGARSAVFGDLPPWTVCMGTPARAVRSRTMRAAPGAT